MSSKSNKSEVVTTEAPKATKRPKSVNAEGKAVAPKFVTPDYAKLTTYPVNLIDSKGRHMQLQTAEWTEGKAFITQLIALRNNDRQASFPTVIHYEEKQSSASLAKRLDSAMKYYNKAASGGVFLTPSEQDKQAKAV